jgi:hypothetical protein
MYIIVKHLNRRNATIFYTIITLLSYLCNSALLIGWVLGSATKAKRTRLPHLIWQTGPDDHISHQRDVTTLALHRTRQTADGGRWFGYLGPCGAARTRRLASPLLLFAN